MHRWFGMQRAAAGSWGLVGLRKAGAHGEGAARGTGEVEKQDLPTGKTVFGVESVQVSLLSSGSFEH